MSNSSNFKVIVALKAAKDQKITSVRCAIQLQDRVKYTMLPQAEGQFFDLNSISLANPLTITFDAQTPIQKRLGIVAIKLSSDIYNQDEIELADIFTLEYQSDQGVQERFTGRYYIIILNKGGLRQPLEEDSKPETPQLTQSNLSTSQQKNLSPTKAYLKATIERSQERQKKDKSKKLLQETKYDPPKKTNFTTFKKETNQQSSKQEIKEKEKEENGQSTPQRSEVKPFQKYNQSTGISPQKIIGDLSSEVEFQRIQIVEMKSKLQQSEANNEINERSLEETRRSEAKRRELQQIIKESVQDNILLKEDIQRNLGEIAREKIDIESKVRLRQQEIEDQNKFEEALKLELSEKENKISILLDKLVAMEEFAKICRFQQDKIEDQDRQIKDNNSAFDSNLSNLTKKLEELEKQKFQADKDRAKADSTLQDLLQNMQKLKENNVSLKSLLEQTERKLQVAQAYEQSAKTLREQNQNLQREIGDQKLHINSLNFLIEQLRKDLENMGKQQQDFDKQYKEKQGSLQDIVKNQDLKIQDQMGQLTNLQKDLLVQKEQIANLLLRSQLADDYYKQLDQYKKDYAALLDDNSKLTATIGELTDQLQISNQQILELRQEVLRQSGMVSDQESYTNNLKRLMLEMEERGVTYIPAKGDDTDMKLANFINSRPDSDKYKQLFVREGEGVYQFGSKKVFVKIEQDKIFIRSGGGYISIEEFLNLFSQREMDNLQRSDPLMTLQKQKAVQRKMDQMRQVTSTRDQISPLRKKGTTYQE